MATNYKKKEAKQYQEEFGNYVAAEAAKQGWVFDATGRRHIYVDAFFVFPRTDMDSNNYWKCMLDAITETKAVWLDDNIVCERTQMIMYDTVNPHVRLEIRYADYIGIFRNECQMENFNERCSSCKRGSRGCSIRKKAIEGKIQEDVFADGDSPYCSKYKKKETKDNGEKRKQGKGDDRDG